ncbi:MAG TPA: hypothetical protein VF658_03915 [Pyrinomonadaceae bacterium]
MLKLKALAFASLRRDFPGSSVINFVHMKHSRFIEGLHRMDYSSKKLVLSLMLFLSAIFPVTVLGQKPLTILDYYLLMPQRYLRYAGGDSPEARQSAIYIKESNYLQARQPNGEFYTALALFKNEDGSDLIAVENRECARGCTEEFFLLRYQNEQWTDVTSQKLPAIDDADVRAMLARQIASNFEPRLLRQLSPGGKSIEVFEYWSGIALGHFEWINGAFVFKPLAAQSTAHGQNVLASVSNAAGDRLQIIAVTPAAPARLPLRGHLEIKIAYDIKSVPRARVFAEPVIDEQFLRDSFNGGSSVYERGSGVRTAYLGFFNQARLNQIEVTMVDEKKNALLTLVYNVDATWEGTLECPVFRISCFPNPSNPGAPISCQLIPMGLSPDARLTYNWSLTNGVIANGQGTRRINLNMTGVSLKDTLVTVEIVGLPSKCPARVTTRVPAGIAGTGSKVVRY